MISVWRVALVLLVLVLAGALVLPSVLRRALFDENSGPSTNISTPASGAAHSATQVEPSGMSTAPVSSPQGQDGTSRRVSADADPGRQRADSAPSHPWADPARVVQAAIESGDGAAALRAVEVIDRCRTVDGAIDSMDRVRPTMNPRQAQIIADLRQEYVERQRLCQLLPAELLATRGALAQQALMAKVQGAAAAVLNGLAPPFDLRQMPAVLTGLHVDDAAGHVPSLSALVVQGSLAGLTAVEQRSYQLALEQIDPRAARMGQEFLEAALYANFPSLRPGALSPDAESAAQARAAAIVQRARRAPTPASGPG